MQALRIRRHLESETIPELLPWVGRKVEIIVLDDSASPVTPGIKPGTGDWEAMRAAVEQIQDYDFDAIQDQDACDLRSK